MPAMVVQDYNPSTQKADAEDFKFEATLGCTVRAYFKKHKN
jgi:hypothetical protein